MKTLVAPIALGLLMFSSAARAQMVDSLAATSFDYYPSVKSDDLQTEVQINVARASVGAPIRLGKDTSLLVGAAYELVDVHSSSDTALQLHAPSLTVGVRHDFSKHWGAIVLGSAGFASDFADPVGSDDLLLSLTGIVTYAVNDSIKLGAGAVYDRRTGDLAPLPALLLSLRLAERWRIRGFAPVWLNAEYRATDLLDLGLRATFEGNRFNVGDERFGKNNVELAYSNLTLGPKVTFNFTDWIHLDLYAAGAVYRRYDLFQNDDRFARHSLPPGVGYGARFWIAPSGW